MSYNSLNLIDGDTLNSTHIRHLEAGMRRIDDEISSMRTSLINILSDKGIIKPANTSFNDLFQEVTYLQAPPVPAYTSTGDVLDVRTGLASGTIKIVFNDTNSGNVGFYIAAQSGVSIDWGDGSAPQTVMTAINSWTTCTHKYTVGSGSPWSGSNTQFVTTITPLVENGIYGWRRHDTESYRRAMLAYASKDIYYRYTSYQFFQNTYNIEYIHIEGGSYGVEGTPFDMQQSFLSCQKLKSIYMPNVVWSQVTSLNLMFSGCYLLTTLQMGNTWNTSLATSMSSMFNGCSSLTEIPSINTSSVTTMNSAFANCTLLETINGSYDLSACRDMASAFTECHSLTTLPILNNMYNITTMQYAFYNCFELVSFDEDQEDFDTELCTNFQYCFKNDAKLEEIPGIDFSAATSVLQMFMNCTSLYILPESMSFPALIGTQYTYTDSGQREGLDSFFENCTAMTTAPSISAPNVLNVFHLFAGCTALVNVPDISFPSAIRAHEMFYNCTSLINAPHHISLPSAQNVRDMFYGCAALKNAPEYDTGETLSFPEAIYAYDLFYGCTSLVNAPRNISLNKATHIYSMFYTCSSMTNAPATIVAPLAQQAYYLFYGCNKMQIPPGNITLASAIAVYGMFYLCTSMLTCPELNLPAAQNLSEMFRGCSGLTSTLPYTFNSATNCSGFYRECSSLKTLEKITVGAPCNFNYFAVDMSPTLITGYWPEATGSGKVIWTAQFWSFVNTTYSFKKYSNVLDGTDGTVYISSMHDLPYIEEIQIKNLQTTLTVQNKTTLTSVRLYNCTNSIGSITLTGNGLTAEALDQLFTDLPTVSSACTINVRQNPGSLTCNTAIATAKNWVVTIV